MKKWWLYAIAMAIAVTIFSSCTTSDDNTVINEGDNGSKVEIISVDSITPYGAIVTAEIIGQQAEERGFCWTEDSLSAPRMPTIDDEFVVAGENFAAKLPLEPGKIFIVRAFALNDNGISYSSAVRVKTLGGKPGIESCVITPDVLSASIKMNLYNNYLPTKIVMTYGIDSCSFTVIIAENVSEPKEFKIEIKGLKRNTQYFYKISAINSGGKDERHGYFTTGHGL